VGARDKLNAVVIWVSLIVSAILGAIMQSWGAFWGILVLLICACTCAGGIRTQPDARPARTARGSRNRRS